jgi:arabinofuranosyltransferase
MSDDAFISMRTASNFLSGYGLTWNPGERVQAFTHPLWMFALIAAHAASGEPFYSVLHLSWLVSCLAVAWLVLSPAGGFSERLLSLALLCSSKAFIDYSSSGLENPLTHLLLAAFATSYLAPGTQSVSLRRLAIIAGLAALNRLDTALLYAPALAVASARAGAGKSLPALLIGAAPLLLWELFSLVYYGFALPNTAYAKLAAGEFAGLTRPLEALHYFITTWRQDPLTLGTIALCALLASLRRDRPRQLLLLGALLYLVYVARIGGDFMEGRFFAAPFFVAVCCLATSSWSRDRSALVSGWTALCVFVSLGDTPPALTGADYAASATKQVINSYGVHDERLAFFPCDSLTNAWRMNPTHADHPWTQQALRIRELIARDPKQRVHVVDAIGHAGYYAGPSVHIVDRWALSEPLLARLPALFGEYGHMVRVPPAGYLETLRTGENRIVHRSLSAYYDQLRSVVRGPLFVARRFAAIARLNLGADDHLLREYAYLQGDTLRVKLHLTNPTNAAEVMVYSWNDGMYTSYTLDSSSQQGKSYDLVWSLSAAGPRLENAEAVPQQQAHGLRQHGVFTLSVALSARHGASQSDIYELRYDYRLEGKTLTVLRDPWSAWIHDFPGGYWRDEPIDHVMTVTDIAPLPSRPPHR